MLHFLDKRLTMMALHRFYDFHFGEGPKICLQTHISQIKDGKCRIETGGYIDFPYPPAMWRTR